MKNQSKKMQKTNRTRTKLRLELIKERGPMCEAKIHGHCSFLADDMHEVLPRGRGGSPTDPENIKLVCRNCHTWIGVNPTTATKLGLLRSWSVEKDGMQWEQ